MKRNLKACYVALNIHTESGMIKITDVRLILR